jgi:hypothetical protein
MMRLNSFEKFLRDNEMFESPSIKIAFIAGLRCAAGIAKESELTIWHDIVDAIESEAKSIEGDT